MDSRLVLILREIDNVKWSMEEDEEYYASLGKEFTLQDKHEMEVNRRSHISRLIMLWNEFDACELDPQHVPRI